MTLEAMNGTICMNNSEVIIKKASTVSFNCTYDLPGKPTTFTWFLNGKLQPDSTEQIAHISIPSGTHLVTCTAYIDATIDQFSENCTCTESKDISVTVVGT